MKTASILTFVFITAAAAATSPGCGKPHNSGFNSKPSTHTITSGGRSRTYAVRVPDNYNTNPSLPRRVILDFHGRNGSPANQYANSKYDSYDAGKEYLAIYPAGVNASWQGAPYAAEGVDDVLFVKELLAHIRTQYCVDDEHIYASGKSNGGGFVDTLACSDGGDEFAAFAMAAAALYDDTRRGRCEKRRAILEVHGGNDTTIPYGGGHTNSGGDVPDIAEWIEWWGDRNELGSDVRNSTNYDGYQKVAYKDESGKNVVEHYKVFDLGHCWPSSTGDNSDGARSYCKDHSLDFTPVVLDFFNDWNLENAPKNG